MASICPTWRTSVASPIARSRIAQEQKNKVGVEGQICIFLRLYKLLFTTKFSPSLICLNYSRDQPLAHTARPWKIPGWIVLVREKISVNKRAYRK